VNIRVGKFSIAYYIVQFFNFITVITSGISLLIVLHLLLTTGTSSFVDAGQVASDVFVVIISAGMLRRKHWAWLLAIIGGMVGLLVMIFYVITNPSLLYFILIIVVVIYFWLIFASRRFFDKT
jgi:hypothetical protein